MTVLQACQLHNRGVIRISGEDRRTFLQGLISNDIELCTPQQPIYAALLTPQGKFLHDMFIIDTGDVFLVDCESARADNLIKRLGMYKLRAKVTLENVCAQYEVWAGWGTNAAPQPWYVDPRLAALGFRAIAQKETHPAPIQHAEFETYDAHRLALGIPDGSRDMIVEKSTLVECNLDMLNAISWTKGCYMGQELTARMHYRGLAKKRLFPVKIEGPAPSFGSLLEWDKDEAGEMRSAHESNGLALLNIEKAKTSIVEDIPMIGDNTRITPMYPEWMKL